MSQPFKKPLSVMQTFSDFPLQSSAEKQLAAEVSAVPFNAAISHHLTKCGKSSLGPPDALVHG